MNNYMTNLTDDYVEFESELEIISLEPEQPQQALEISQTLRNQSRRWQLYLQALALLAFEEWLQKREPGILINREKSSVFQLSFANLIDTVHNLGVGEFKVCLIPTISFTSEEVTVPRAVVDLPEFIAHFYVVIGIEEELEIAVIRGFLRYDQLVNYQSELQAEVDWNYHLPLAWFNCEPNELLLYLQCLAPTAIPLPEIPSNRQASLRRMQATLLNLLPQLHNRPLWQVLTWEQGTAVLTSPELLNWLYCMQTQHEQLSIHHSHLSDLLQILTQQAVNVGRWLSNQMDEAVQALSWEVLPVGSALRKTEQTPAQELEEILTDIRRSNQLEIPASALRAYREILLESLLRLYAVTWSLPDENSGWALLLVLQTISGNQFSKLILRVSDQTEVLVEEELFNNSNHNYIFTQVEGSYEDKFLVTLTTATGSVQTLPPFEFTRE